MITLANRTYHICFDQNYTAAVVREWIESGKNQSIILRNARKNVERSVVLVIKDRNGDDLPLIKRIVFVSKGKVFVE